MFSHVGFLCAEGFTRVYYLGFIRASEFRAFSENRGGLRFVQGIGLEFVWDSCFEG